MVFISTMSAPQASRALVSWANSSAGIRGLSNRAEPPPETSRTTVSLSLIHILKISLQPRVFCLYYMITESVLYKI